MCCHSLQTPKLTLCSYLSCQVGDFSCSCPPGTEGSLCETNLDDCRPDSCFNGGQCMDRVGTFECRCPPGYTGQRWVMGQTREMFSCFNPFTI